MRSIRVFIALAMTLAVAPVQAGFIIDTTASTPGSIGTVGEPANTTFGETFTVVGANTHLDSFSFFLNDLRNPDSVDFAFYLAAWDGTKATGSILYQSGMMTTTNNHGADGFEKFTFSPDITLISGAKYVAFVSTADYFDGINGGATMPFGTLAANPYSGGEFVFANGSVASLFANNWNQSFAPNDTRIVASFTEPAATTPEPGSVVLLGVGGGLLGLGRRVRRRNTELAA